MTDNNTQDEAKRIWAQLDSEDAGDSPVPTGKLSDASELPGTAQAAPTLQAQAPAEEVDDQTALRNKLAGMEAMVQQLSGRLRNAEGHIGGLNSQLKSQLDAAKTLAQAGGDAPSAREIRDAQDNPEALAELARDYPELAKALAPAMEATFQARFAELEKRLPQGSQADSTNRQELEAFKSEMRVESRHPGWQETVKAAEFTGWLQSSPRELQLLAASNEPSDAIRLLDKYSESRNSAPTQRTQRMNSAAAMPMGQRTPARTKNVDDMTPQEFWRYQDQLDKSKA
jgi:hypothetical protein